MMSGGLQTKNMYLFEHSMSLRDETRQVQSGELNTRHVEIKQDKVCKICQKNWASGISM